MVNYKTESISFHRHILDFCHQWVLRIQELRCKLFQNTWSVLTIDTSVFSNNKYSSEFLLLTLCSSLLFLLSSGWALFLWALIRFGFGFLSGSLASCKGFVSHCLLSSPQLKLTLDLQKIFFNCYFSCIIKHILQDCVIIKYLEHQSEMNLSVLHFYLLISIWLRE